MLEGSVGFEKLTIREKQTVLIKKSNYEIREWYFNKGMENELPKNWDKFKEIFVEYCIDQGIENVRKYNDETWSEYVKRLKMISENKNIEQPTVMRKLKVEPAPRDLQMLFLIVENNLDRLIIKIEELEEVNTIKQKIQK